MMKKILIAVVALAPVLCWGQDAARWAKARDFLSSQLALEAIRGKAQTDTSVRAKFEHVKYELADAKIGAPLNAEALDALLKDFPRVRQLVVDPIEHIDLRRFAAMKHGESRLVDTVMAIVDRGYTIDMATKMSIGTEVVNFISPPSEAI
jgi:hypothetical protein